MALKAVSSFKFMLTASFESGVPVVKMILCVDEVEKG
jgi:hypothetical protein